VRIVAGGVADYAALPLQAPVKLGVGQRDQRADHGDRDSRLLYELDLEVENILGIAVEADNESARYLQPFVLYLFYALEDIGLGVLLFLG